MKTFRFILIVLPGLMTGMCQSAPDLVVTDIWNDGSIIRYQIRNVGPDKTTGNFVNRLDIDGSLAALDYINIEIRPGERITRYFEKYDWQCGGSTDQVQVITDVDNDIVEVKETNNTRTENWICDTAPPVITSGPDVTPLKSTAIVSWTTNEPCTSTVQYDSRPGIFGLSESDSTPVTNHQLVLSNLTPSTTYHLKVVSQDASVNVVQSAEVYFQTLASGDSTDPTVSAVESMVMHLPGLIGAEADDNMGVEHVEFFMNGQFIGADYSAPFSVPLNPQLLGMTRTEMIAEHLLEARAYDVVGNAGMMSAAWSFLENCGNSGAQLRFVYPQYEAIINTDGLTAPNQDTEILVYAVKTESIGSLMNSHWPRNLGENFDPHITWVPMDPGDIEFTLNGNPITATYNGDYPWMEDVSSYLINLGGRPLGDYTLRIHHTTDTGCPLGDSTTLRVVRNTPILEIERQIYRDLESYTVRLNITNVGTAPAVLDTLRDSLIGLQVWDSDTLRYNVTAMTYDPVTKKSVLELDFTTHVMNTLDPGETESTDYRAVPILYNEWLFDDYRFGGDGFVTFHDAYQSYHQDHDDVSFRDMDGRRIPVSVNYALAEADYLVVTNPQQLFRLNDEPDVNLLLAKAARLADSRNGVLGYYYSYFTLFTFFEGGQLADTGNIFNDTHDEIILIDMRTGTDEDRIMAYDDTRSRGIHGQFPINIGLDAVQPGDQVLVGDVLPSEGGVRHAEVEILYLNGHAPSPAEGFGRITIYKYLPVTDTFETSAFTIPDYVIGEPVFCADILSDPAWPSDEILVVRDDGTVDVYAGLDPGSHTAISTNYDPGDLIAVGDILGTSRDEIIIANRLNGRFYAYDDSGGGAEFVSDDTVSVSALDALAVGDIIGDDKDDIVFADASEHEIVIFDFHRGSPFDPTLVRLPVTIEIDDHLMVGDVLATGKSEVLLARGTNRPAYKGTIEILHMPEGQTYDNRFRLDELISEHGDWTDKLSPDFLTDGYLLILGETTVIPACSLNYSSSSEDWRAYYTDSPYASTIGTSNDTAELSVGRIPGNSAADILTILNTQLDMVMGTYVLNNTDAYLCRGYSCGPSGTSACLDFEGGNATIASILGGYGFTTLSETFEDPGAITEPVFFSHLPDNDIIYLGAHGSWAGWDEVSQEEIRDNFNPGATRPLVHALSCSTAQYPSGTSVVERFLRGGASAYIGGTSRLDFGGSQPLYERFYEGLDSGIPIAKAFRDAKNAILAGGVSGTCDVVLKYNCAANHYFGDPKLAFSGFWAGDPPVMNDTDPILSDTPPTSVQIAIPDYQVDQIDGKDRVRIPGFGLLLEYGEPMVPVYTYSIPLDAGWRVLGVSMSNKGEMQQHFGYDLPVYTRQILGEESFADSPEGEGWYPEREFDWKIEPGADGKSRLILIIYPFYHNPATLMSRFYKNYSFSIQYHTSAVTIHRLFTDNGICEPSRDVLIDAYLYNTAGAADLLVETVILNGRGEQTDALPIRRLNAVRNGFAFYSCRWNSAGFDPGDYRIDMTLRGVDGKRLDRRSLEFNIGRARAEMIDFKIEPDCFGPGELIAIDTALMNTGDVPVSGSVVVQVQTLEGELIEQFSREFENLLPGEVNVMRDNWTAALPRGQCRIIAFGQYEGLNTPEEIFPEVLTPLNGDLNLDDVVNIEDFALLAPAWLLNQPLIDLAPPGGDCIVDSLDLRTLADAWMNFPR